MSDLIVDTRDSLPRSTSSSLAGAATTVGIVSEQSSENGRRALP